MKLRVADTGKTVEWKEIKHFGCSVGIFDTEERGKGYLGVLLSNNEDVSKLLRSRVKESIYFYKDILYIDFEGEEFRYMLSLIDDETSLASQIKRDGVLFMAVLAEDEVGIEFSAVGDIIS